MAKRRSKDSDYTQILIAGLVGLGVYALVKRNAHAAVTLPSIPAPVSNPTASTPRVTPGTATTSSTVTIGSTPALIARLTASGSAGALARQVFYGQSMLYSYGHVPDFPDGRLGPDTWSEINTLRATFGLPQDTVWSIGTLDDLLRCLKRTSGLPAPRILPFALPSSVVDRINSEVVSLLGNGAPVLQAYAV